LPLLLFRISDLVEDRGELVLPVLAHDLVETVHLSMTRRRRPAAMAVVVVWGWW
jgi:hypothetical protein